MSTDGLREAVSVDYAEGENQSSADYPSLTDKIEKAIAVTQTGLEQYRNPAVMWTGGKDSTLALYFVAQVVAEYGYDRPPAVFIDHFQHFQAVHDFVEHWADEWGLELIYAQNDDVGAYVEANGLDPADDIPVGALNERNRIEVVEKLEHDEETFPFLLDTYVGNHLLKTVALNDAIETHDIDGIISGVRWDEQDARADETFFSPRHDSTKYPPHDRVHPILPFEERAVWDAAWNYVVPDAVPRWPDEGYVPRGSDDLPEGLTHADVPVSPKYFEGYRSLGSAVSTKKPDEEPAWLQDLESTVERAGRAQDKENLMERLRDLGYM